MRFCAASISSGLGRLLNRLAGLAGLTRTPAGGDFATLPCTGLWGTFPAFSLSAAAGDIGRPLKRTSDSSSSSSAAGALPRAGVAMSAAMRNDRYTPCRKTKIEIFERDETLPRTKTFSCSCILLMGASSMHAHGATPASADEAAAGMRRRKYGSPEPVERDERANERVAVPGADYRRRYSRGPLANAEAAVCVCAAGGAGLRALCAFGVEAVGTDLAAVAILVALCWHAEGTVRRSPLYREGADPGVLAGCTAVPALVIALMLRKPAGSTAEDLEAPRFFLRLAVSCSGMVLSEAVLGDGKWGGSGTRWLDEMRAAVVLVLLGLPAAAWHSEKSHL